MGIGGSVLITEAKRKAFIAAIVAVSKEHQLSLAHEDNHGAFIVEAYKPVNIEWLECADVEEAQ